MAWVLLGVILGSLVYIVSIGFEYKTFLEEIQPRIRDMEKRAVRFDKGTEAERILCDQAQERTEQVRDVMIQQNQDMKAAQMDAKKAKQQEESLEMSMYKREFKRAMQA